MQHLILLEKLILEIGRYLNAESLLLSSYLPVGNDLYQIGVEEMIKRISIILCVVLLLVVIMAVPAFATDVRINSNNIISQPVSQYVARGESAYFTISCSGDVTSYSWELSDNNGISWMVAPGQSANSSRLGIKANISTDGYLFRCVVTFSDGSVLISDVVGLYIYPLKILAVVSGSIHYVLNWVGNLVNSFVTPEGLLNPLLPVLAIGISITAVLLVTKIFKSFSWGL